MVDTNLGFTRSNLPPLQVFPDETFFDCATDSSSPLKIASILPSNSTGSEYGWVEAITRPRPSWVSSLLLVVHDVLITPLLQISYCMPV